MKADRLVVFGGTSKIAGEVARLAARDKSRIFLVGRRPERLEHAAGDLLARGATSAEWMAADLADVSSHGRIVAEAESRLPDFDTVLCSYGTLTAIDRAESLVDSALAEIETNFTSTVSLLTLLAPYFERRRAGCITVISSVAGERGRRSNYVYGSAKGGLSIFLQGYRARLFRFGVRVLTVKPGPVESPMTAHLPSSSLFASPAAVGYRIYREMTSGTKDVLYAPRYWRYVMAGVRGVPEWLAKRLSF
jgi:short-subunit dehydrogenase